MIEYHATQVTQHGVKVGNKIARNGRQLLMESICNQVQFVATDNKGVPVVIWAVLPGLIKHNPAMIHNSATQFC